jgi:hypothetical protein
LTIIIPISGGAIFNHQSDVHPLAVSEKKNCLLQLFHRDLSVTIPPKHGQRPFDSIKTSGFD